METEVAALSVLDVMDAEVVVGIVAVADVFSADAVVTVIGLGASVDTIRRDDR